MVAGAGQMVVGVRSDCLGKDSTPPDLLRAVADLGFDFIEVVLPPESIDRHASLLSSWAEASTASGMPVLSVATAHCVHLMRLTPEEQGSCRDLLVEVVNHSADVGADAVLVAVTESVLLDDPAAADAIRLVISPAAEAAARRGVVLALEHVGDTRPDEAARFVADLAEPAVRLYFDVGNCFHVGVNPLEQARRCAPVTAHVHLKQGPTTPLAAMPLRAILNVLTDGGFRGRVCLEEPASRPGSTRHLRDAKAVLSMAGLVAPKTDPWSAPMAFDRSV